MQEQNFNHQNGSYEQEPYDQEETGFYETGSTRPPKSRSGLIAVVLISGIVLGSMLSMLGGVRAALIRQLDGLDDPEEHNVSLIVEETTAATEPPMISRDQTVTPPADVGVDLETSPLSADNPSQPGGLPLQQIYQEAIDSVVSISCVTGAGVSSGTGVVLSEDGYLITNAHVIKDAGSISVLFTDGTTAEARVVGADQVSDLAVLYVQAEGLSPARFGDSAALRVGDAVVAIGDPLGLNLRGTMTNGIVSAINRDLTVGGRTMTVIQTNAALNSGNSGGPLINCYGQVVGINTMKIGDSVSAGGVEGLGFAIPSTTVKHVVDQLISQGYVSGRPGLGLSATEVPNLYQYYYSVPAGLYVNEVTAGSQAAAAGIQVKDILLTIDDQRVRTEEELQKLLLSHQVGDSVEVVLYRNGQQITVRLTLDESRI